VKVQSFKEIIEADMPEYSSWMGDRLLVPGGRLLLFGAPETYKSFAVQWLLYCLAEGKDWYGQPVHYKGNTLYVEVEIGDYMFQERTMSIHKEHGMTDGAFYSTDYGVKLATQEDANEIITHIEEHDIQMVFFDPVNLIMRGSERNDEHVSNFLSLCNYISGATGCGVGCIHHSRKSQYTAAGKIDGGAEEASGVKNFWSWADTMVRLVKVPGIPNTIKLSYEKHRHTRGNVPFVYLELDSEKGLLVPAQADPITKVRALLEAGPRTINDIDDLLGDLKVAVNLKGKFRNELIEQGIVEEYTDPNNKRVHMLQLRGR
jgi:hypothetical protein